MTGCLWRSRTLRFCPTIRIFEEHLYVYGVQSIHYIVRSKSIALRLKPNPKKTTPLRQSIRLFEIPSKCPSAMTVLYSKHPFNLTNLRPFRLRSSPYQFPINPQFIGWVYWIGVGETKTVNFFLLRLWFFLDLTTYLLYSVTYISRIGLTPLSHLIILFNLTIMLCGVQRPSRFRDRQKRSVELQLSLTDQVPRIKEDMSQPTHPFGRIYTFSTSFTPLCREV